MEPDADNDDQYSDAEAWSDQADADTSFDGPNESLASELVDRATKESSALFSEYYAPDNPHGLFQGATALDQGWSPLSNSEFRSLELSSLNSNLSSSELTGNNGPMPVERTLGWLTGTGEERGMPVPSPFDVLVGAIDMTAHFLEMRQVGAQLREQDRSRQGLDKYYHCKSNCAAAERGPGGLAAAAVISVARELVDHYVKHPMEGRLSTSESLADCQEDMRANRTGWEGALTGVRCSSACESFRPKGL